MADKKYRTLAEFYPFYLGEHKRTGTRVLHFAGTTLFLMALTTAAIRNEGRLILAGVIGAYACAWIGHFFIERNRPATFKDPFYSLASDFVFYFEVLAGRRSLKGTSRSSIRS
jgi:hypothetical protein